MGISKKEFPKWKGWAIIKSQTCSLDDKLYVLTLNHYKLKYLISISS